MPFFSIIIPTFNRAEKLVDAVNSVLNQVFQDWELLLIDDGSTDLTSEIIQDFQDSRIKYFYKNNEERSIARNFGIQKAQGEYICFLDSDDIFFSNHLLILYKNIQMHEFPVGIFHTQIIKNLKGEKTKENWFRGLDNKQVVEKLIKGKALYMNGICISNRLLENEMFPPQFSYWEDQHLWIRLLKEHPFFSIDDTTSQWNIDDENSTLDFYKGENLNNLDKYLGCINHLEKDLRAKEKLTLKEEKDFLKLKLKKASGFINIKPKYFFFSLRQFFICSKYISIYKLFGLYLRLLRKDLKI